MKKSQKSPRERAARALCRFNGAPEDTQFEGRPMWQSYLAEVDVVLEAAIGTEEMDHMKRDDGAQQ